MRNLFNKYDVQADDLANQKAVLESMLAGNLQPLQLPQQGDVQAKINPLSLVLQALTGAAGEASKQGIADKQQELFQQYNSDKGTAMRNIFNAMAGKDNTGTPVTGIDPREAILQAMSSDFPEIQEIGKSMMKAQAEGSITAKDLLSHANPNSIPAIIANGVSGFQPKLNVQEYKDFGMYDANTMQPLQFPFQPPKNLTINGSLMQQYPTGVLDMVDKAPKTTVNNMMPAQAAGETAFAKTLGEKNAATVVDIGNSIKQAQSTLALADDLEQLNPDMFEGAAAPATLFLGQLAKSFGLYNDEGLAKVAATEKGEAVLSKEIASYLTASGGVGRSMTDADRKKIEQQWGTIANTREGRQEIVNFLKAKSQGSIENLGKTLEEVSKTHPDAANLIKSTGIMSNTPASRGVPSKSTSNKLPPAASAPPGAVGWDTETSEWVFK